MKQHKQNFIITKRSQNSVSREEQKKKNFFLKNCIFGAKLSTKFVMYPKIGKNFHSKRANEKFRTSNCTAIFLTISNSLTLSNLPHRSTNRSLENLNFKAINLLSSHNNKNKKQKKKYKLKQSDKMLEKISQLS